MECDLAQGAWSWKINFSEGFLQLEWSWKAVFYCLLIHFYLFFNLGSCGGPERLFFCVFLSLCFSSMFLNGCGGL